MGVKWSSGPVASAACGCDIHLLGVLAHLASTEIPNRHLFPLLANAPYRDQLLAISMDSDEWENIFVAKIMATRRYETPEKAAANARLRIKRRSAGIAPGISIRGVLKKPRRESLKSKAPIVKLDFREQPLPSAAKALYENAAYRRMNESMVSVAKTSRDKLIASTVVPEDTLALLDVAWQKWHLTNPEGSDMPERMAEIVNDLTLFVSDAPDKYRVDQAWSEYKGFIGRLPEPKDAHDTENVKILLMSSNDFKKLHTEQRKTMIETVSSSDIQSTQS